MTERPSEPVAITSWTACPLVRRTRETPSASTLALDVPGWPGHLPGQHVDIRLRADDGYVAQRSYSIASPPGAPLLEVTVDRLADGEVSPYLVDDLPTGAPVELRGPIGGYFVRRPEDTRPLVLIAGGSGVVPLACMLRDREQRRARRAARGPDEAADGPPVPAVLLLSARRGVDVIYAEELAEVARSHPDDTRIEITVTRERSPLWRGRTGRIDAPLLDEVVPPPREIPAIFVCGPAGFVEAVAVALVAAGHDPDAVRTERFGPT